MRRAFVLLALCALWGCNPPPTPTQVVFPTNRILHESDQGVVSLPRDEIVTIVLDEDDTLRWVAVESVNNADFTLKQEYIEAHGIAVRRTFRYEMRPKNAHGPQLPKFLKFVLQESKVNKIRPDKPVDDTFAFKTVAYYISPRDPKIPN